MKRLLALASACLLFTGLCHAASEAFHQSIPLSANGSVELDNINGSIEIIGWDKPEVTIDAEKSASSDAALQRLHIKVSAAPDSVSVSTDYEKKAFNFSMDNRKVNYRICMPAGANVRKVNTVNSSVSVTGITGKIQVSTVNGTITVTGLQATSTLETVNGGIHASTNQLPEGAHLKASVVNGSCDLTVPSDVSARIDAHTVNGHISCDLPISNSSVKKHSLQGTLGTGNASLSLGAVNGSISINKR